jgi:hypothetical protein
MSKTEIIELVRRYTDATRLRDIYFVVDEKGVIVGDGWYRVPVRPSRLPERLFEFYELLVETGEEIAEKEGINVLLMTGEPLEAPDGEAATVTTLTAA